MYKCSECGNTEKFEGIAREEGTVEICRYGNRYQWHYKLSDNKWKSDFTVKRCFFCKSEKIIEI